MAQENWLQQEINEGLSQWSKESLQPKISTFNTVNLTQGRTTADRGKQNKLMEFYTISSGKVNCREKK